MRKLLLPVLTLVFSVSLLSSCKREKEDLSGLSDGYKYFPLEIGKYILYDVDSTIWDDFLKAEIHHRSQMRYEVVDTFRNETGSLSYVINIRSRKTNAEPFVESDVIYVTPNDNRVVVSQQNLKYIKLIFPVVDGATWDGNAMIPLGDADYQQFDNEKWVYTYSDEDEPFNPGNNLYDHTVTVNHIDDRLNDPDADSTAYAYRNYSKEIYAFNVGMIYKERIFWEFQPKSPDGSSGGSGYRKGYGVLMKAVENN